MTVLDTFLLLFKTDIPASASKDIAGLDKQLDDLGKKGKKRDDAENKQQEVRKKYNKEQLDNIKQQQRETDRLRDSFTGMAQSAVGALTAYASFSVLKAGLIDANNLNTAFKVLSQTYGSLQPQQTKALGIAFERSTGIKSDVMVSFLQQKAAAANAIGAPFNPTTYLGNLSAQARRSSPGQIPLQQTQISGIASIFPYLQKTQAEQDAALKEGLGLAGKPEDFTAAQENTKNIEKTSEAFGLLATQIDTQFSKAIENATRALQGLANIFNGHPNIAAAAGGGLALGTSVYAYKALSWLGKLVSGGGSVVSSGGDAIVAASGAGTGILANTSLASLWGSLIPSVDAHMKQISPAYRRLTGGSSANRNDSVAFWQSQGYNAQQAAAWAAAEQSESSGNPRAQNGSHLGLFQWSSSRRAKILAGTGIDISTAGHADQLRAAAWEARQMGFGPLSLPTSTRGASDAITNGFEIPASGYQLLLEDQKRGGLANSIYNSISSNAGKTISIKTGDITIHTQANDASGIAYSLGDEIAMMIANFDDGQFA